MLILSTGCGSSLPALGNVGPPESGWSGSNARPECAGPDVAPRLHFSRVSDLSWMNADERVLLATPNLANTRGADPEVLEREAIDGAMRVLAPIGLEAAGAPAQAARLRAAPAVRSEADLEQALSTVEAMEAELPRGARGHRVLAVLARGMSHALSHPFPGSRCAYIVGHGTIESEVAAAAIEAGAPRSQVTEASVDLLAALAEDARRQVAQESGVG